MKVSVQHSIVSRKTIIYILLAKIYRNGGNILQVGNLYCLGIKFCTKSQMCPKLYCPGTSETRYTSLTELPGQNLSSIDSAGRCSNRNQCLFDLLSNVAANNTKQLLMRFIDRRR